jgi:hypothetical protein
MILDTITLLILATYLYVLFTMVGKDDYSSMLIITLVVCIVLCWKRRGNFIDGFHPGEFAYLDTNNHQNVDSMPKHFASVVDSIAKKQQPVNPPSVNINNDPGLLYNNVSAYDGLCLKTGNSDAWRHSPANVPLVNDKNLYTIMGHDSALKPVLSDPSSLSGPPIDGDPNSPNKMFMFANNQSSPMCCPSTFSTSTGCVCTTDKQMDYVAARGNNNF